MKTLIGACVLIFCVAGVACSKSAQADAPPVLWADAAQNSQGGVLTRWRDNEGTTCYSYIGHTTEYSNGAALQCFQKK